MDWYLKVLRQYADFSGRARRKEYWMFVLFNFLIVLALALIDALLGLGAPEAGWGVLSGLYMLAVLIPGLAVTFRRLHDTGRSGWWILVGIIPLVGAIVLLVFFFQDSERGTNPYGPSPKYPESAVGESPA